MKIYNTETSYDLHIFQYDLVKILEFSDYKMRMESENILKLNEMFQ